MKNIDDLWEHIAYVLAYAPDKFPYRDFLSNDEQMNLDNAFKQLREGVQIAYPEDKFSGKRAQLNMILNRSYMAYKDARDIEAGHLLNEFQSNIFKTE